MEAEVKNQENLAEVGFDVEKAEYSNLLNLVRAGKTPSKDQRHRIGVLARKLSAQGFDFDFVASAKALGAYDEKDALTPGVTKAMMAERLDSVEQWLRWGWTRHKITTESARAWGVTAWTARKYIKSATLKIAARLDRVRDSQAGLIVEKLNECYGIARDNGNVNGMIEALDRMAKVLGLHKPAVARVEVFANAGAIGSLKLPEKDSDVIDVVDTTPRAIGPGQGQGQAIGGAREYAEDED